MRRILTPLGLLLATAACSTVPTDRATSTMVAPVLTSADARDPFTYARPEVARVTHAELDLSLDFAGKSVGGTATLDVLAAPGAQELVLDSKGLLVSRVTDALGKDLPHTIGKAEEGKGSPLAIAIGPGPERRRVVIHYNAAPDAEALQWLAPEQTAGKVHPFLLSQGQPTLNRTWIPLQDSPGIRVTWGARIRVPAPLNVVMSGERLPPDIMPAGATHRTFRFRMDKPVPPYLIAIAAGDIDFRELGPRTGVWAEPALLDAAAYETADTEKMVTAAEKLYGPYRWGRYDMIVLPPAFPYGGMENPVMTFLTPTFIAGDRSLNGLVAHELAHSWSGNLVTNANWADSWLNEGTTSYFENRIIEALYGTKRAQQEAALSFADMEAVLADKDVRAQETALHLPDGVAGPEAGHSGIIYDKGAAFFRTVETIAGRERFDAWLRQWFDNHAFQPATSAMLVHDMHRNLIKGDAALAERLMLDQWIYRPGLPGNVARPDPAAFAEVDAAAAGYGLSNSVPTAAWAGWTTVERLRFMAKLPQDRTPSQLAALDQTLGLSRQGNNEILFAWLKLALTNRYEPAVPLAEQFLARVGRRKFVAPLFETLMGEGDWGKAHARRIYGRTRPTYHAVTRGTVDKLVLKTG
jgi:leukotriene-A4 hydrolase